MQEKRQWVCHISGQGEKWLVVYGGDPIDWMVLCKATDGERNRALPKSEYRLCDPPEVWRDVSSECEVSKEGAILHGGVLTSLENGYRRRKVAMELRSSECYEPVKFAIAIVIEQKVTG